MSTFGLMMMKLLLVGLEFVEFLGSPIGLVFGIWIGFYYFLQLSHFGWISTLFYVVMLLKFAAELESGL